MSNPYTDPTSIDYVLQRAQDDLRRGEHQHYRSTEAQYTNHVKELLGNLERYLETCGVQLPTEVMTGAEATAAAAAAAQQEAHAQADLARSMLSAQMRGILGAKRSSAALPSRSASEAAVLENAGGPCISGEYVHARVGWGALATPTAAQQRTQGGEDGRADFATATAAVRRVKSVPASAAATAPPAGLGDSDARSPVSPVRRRAVASRFATADAEHHSSSNGSRGATTGGSAYDARPQHTPTKLAEPPSPHSPPGARTSNPTMAPLDATPVRESPSYTGAPPARPQQQRTPHTEALSTSANLRFASPEAVTVAAATAAAARSLSANAPHLGSGNDPWGDFGQFVQSITESKLNSNLTSLQSAAAAAFPSPTGYVLNNGSIHPVPATNTARGHESAAPFAVAAAPPAVVPENGFQLPHVLATATSLASPSTKDLPMPPLQQQQQQQPSPSQSQQQQQQQQQRPQHASQALGWSSSPLGIASAASFAGNAPESGSTQDVSSGSSQLPPTSTAEITSISSHSPSIPLQAAYGAGSNAVRALASTADADDVQVKSPDSILNSPYVSPTWATPSRAAGADHVVKGAATPVEHIPSPPQHPRSSVPHVPLQASATMQRAASLPAASYLPYGHGGSPYYPHILRISPSVPTTQLSSSTLLLASNKSPALTQSPPPLSPPQREGDNAPSAVDGAVVHSREKEMLMRRLRGILDKSSSASTTQSVITSFVDTGSGPSHPATTTTAGDAGAPQLLPAQSRVVTVNALHVDHDRSPNVAVTLDASHPPASVHAVGATYPPALTAYNPSSRSPLQDEYPLEAPSATSLSDTDNGNGNVNNNTLHSSSNLRGTSTAPSGHMSGTGVYTTGESWGALRSNGSTKANNPQQRTPSSKDMGSLPTGLYSASRRTLLSYDPGVGGTNAGLRGPQPSPQNPPPPTRQSSDSSHTASVREDASSRRDGARGSYTAVPSTTAPTYPHNGDAHLCGSPSSAGVGVTTRDASMGHAASAEMLLDRRGSGNGARRKSAWIDMGDNTTIDLSDSEGNRDDALPDTEARQSSYETQYSDNGEQDWRTSAEVERGGKQQLMHRLRMVLSRSDE